MGGGGIMPGPCICFIISIMLFSVGIWLSIVSATLLPNLYIT